MKPSLNALALVLLLAINVTINAVPQRQRPRQQQQAAVDPSNPDIQRAIEEVFTTPATPNRGFAAIVTPDPTFVPTTAPQTMLTANNQPCTCIPYHMCNPSDNTAREMVDDDKVTGFGLIDIRFDPSDCVDVLDVCCLGVNQREETIVPVQPTNKPTRASGCGIRNVGGLDFEITGAFVSSNRRKLFAGIRQSKCEYNFIFFTRTTKLDSVNFRGQWLSYESKMTTACAAVH